jgi:RimJ/RimL family protein N-acetyltransferase
VRFDDAALTLSTRRLSLEPIRPEDADDLVAVLDDDALHEFIGGHPATLAELRERWRRWSARRSPDGRELWLNWVLRSREENRPMGTLQATVLVDQAAVAWVVGRAWQGRGYATEAARALVDWLVDGLQVRDVVAYIHPEHQASARVAANAGLVATDETVDGELVWRLRAHGPRTK